MENCEKKDGTNCKLYNTEECPKTCKYADFELTSSEGFNKKVAKSLEIDCE